MLNVDTLQKQIQQSIEDIFPIAFEQALLETMPTRSKEGNELAKQFGKTITDQLAESLSNALAGAIDYYVKSAEIFGKMQILGVTTVGSPTSQVQAVPLPITVDTLPISQGGGNLPGINTLLLGIK